MHDRTAPSLFRRTRLFALLPLAIVAVAALAFAACGSDEKESIRSAVEGIRVTINRAEAGTAYDRFGANLCKTVPGRDAFARNFDEAPYEIQDLLLLDDNIQINGDRAFLIITADFRQRDGSSEQRTVLETLLKEGDRWKDEDCFQGGLGNIARAPSGLPGEFTPTPVRAFGTPTPGTPGAATPSGTPAAATPAPGSTAPAGTTTAATPSPAPGGA